MHVSTTDEMSKSTMAIFKIKIEDEDFNSFRGSLMCAMIKRKFPTMPIRLTARTNPKLYTAGFAGKLVELFIVDCVVMPLLVYF